MTTAPSSKALSLALSMIDRRAWRLPAQVVDLIRAVTIDDPLFPRDELVLLGHRQVAEWFKGEGCDHRYVYRVMRELADQGVLRRVAGAGRRPDAWGVNAIALWRDVPWSVPRELVLRRVADACAPPFAPQGIGSAAMHAAALGDVAPRSLSRHNEGLVPRSGSRHNGFTRAATRNAAQSDSVDAPYLSSRDKSLSTEGGRESIEVVIKAIRAKTGAKVWGAPARKLDELVATAGEQVVLEAIALAPPGLGSPKLVEWVADELEARAPAPKDADWFRRRAMAIEAQLLHLDADDDQAVVLAAELTECENQLHAMNGSNR